MKNYEKEVELAKLKDEKAVLNRLKGIYKQAANDVQKKIKLHNGKIDFLLQDFDNLSEEEKSILQSQIYQKKYQQQIQSQLDKHMAELNSNQYKALDAYLKKCHETGALGVMYSLHKQRIPLIMPIDPKQMVKAATLNSKISKKLYGKYTNDMKKWIQAEVSRGVATSLSYSEIARNIDNRTNVGLNRAMTIARTEGGKINNQARYDEVVAAKEAGADIVLQWNAALDKRTRSSHAKLDGQIVDVGEKFSNGLLFPCDPQGTAAEVINCRCALLQRARWALDDDELETLKERAEYFGLDKTKDFDDFVRKYVKAADIVPLMEVAVAGGLQVYKKEEIEAMALKTSEIANKHIANESKWSGHIEINDESGKSGKLWNCDIRTMSETSPFIILHEQIHAHSISHADEDTYLKYGAIEEATVQFMAQEISKKEGIEIIESGYDDMVDSLRKLKSKLKIDKTDYDFAKELIEMPVAERLDWLEEKAYNIMQDGGTIEEYQELNELIDMLR